MNRVLLDMNWPTFQEKLFTLEQSEKLALLKTLEKIRKLTWDELQKSAGIKWELISPKKSNDERIYSFRFSQKYRGTGYRNGDYLVLLNLFPNHDGAYE